MSKFMKKTLWLFFGYDLFSVGGREKRAKRQLERVATVMESQPSDYFFSSAFASVGKHLNNAVRKGLDV